METKTLNAVTRAMANTIAVLIAHYSLPEEEAFQIADETFKAELEKQKELQ